MPHHEGYRNEGSGTRLQNIKLRAEVYGSDNQKIGIVDEVGPDYFRVGRGFPYEEIDWCIPSSGIARIEDKRVFLNVPSDRIEKMGWTNCPEHSEARTRGGEVYSIRKGQLKEPGLGRPGYHAGTKGLNFNNIQKGWEVYCSDKGKVGNIDVVTNDYILIKEGPVSNRALYIPKDGVDYVEEGRVFLNVPCDVIASLNWNQPPGGGSPSSSSGI